ncbi:MAG: hypothetical protein IT349_17390 [Candidatus Eisenbacteria bacterium]|nr:hypothetical protein [Candidatus Eisenbacteria bacterium]
MKDRNRANRTLATAGIGLWLLSFACSDSENPPAPPVPDGTRTYAMGFSWFPPRPELSLALEVADLVAEHADAALILVSPPWRALIEGASAEALVRGNELGQADLFRGKGLPIVVSIDPTDGTNRALDAPELRALGRSLTETSIQELYRDYVLAIDRLLHPDVMTIASETNLVRALSPGLYAGVVRAANDAATALRASGSGLNVATTVQVEVAWGRPEGEFIGIAQDRADFPFIHALGLSSYPRLAGFAEPDSIPDDYYLRLVASSPLPLLMIEGGWPSDTASGSSPELQRRYLRRQSVLLDGVRAVGWFQINFTDLDAAHWPPEVGPFTRLGLVDTSLAAKPALADWDQILLRRRTLD